MVQEIRERKFLPSLRIAVVILGGAVLVGLIATPLVNGMQWSLLELLLLVAVLLVAVAPAFHALNSGIFDMFEPVYLICLATIVSFVVAPILFLRSELFIDPDSGLDLRTQAIYSILLSGLALTAFYFGYYPARRYWSRKPFTRIQDWLGRIPSSKTVNHWALTGLILSFGLFGLYLQLAGIPLGLLNALSSESTYRAVILEAQSDVLFLYLVRISWSVLVLLAYPTDRKSLNERILISLAWIIAFLLLFLSGNRGVVIRLIIATVAYYYLIKNRRPSLVLVGFFVMLFLLLASSIVLLRRNQRTGLTLSEVNPSLLNQSLEREITEGGALLSMSYLFYVFPEKIDYVYFELFEEVPIALVPRAAWPAKPTIRGVTSLADGYVGRAHAPPFFGIYYSAFGWVGAMISMSLLGVCMAWIYSLWKQVPHSIITQVTLAVCLGLLWELYHRGGLIWVLTNSFFTYAPIILVALLAGLTHQDRKRIG